MQELEFIFSWVGRCIPLGSVISPRFLFPLSLSIIFFWFVLILLKLIGRGDGAAIMSSEWLAVVILAGSIFGYFASGIARVATADAPMPFERKLADMALNAHIEKQHVVQSPVVADEPAFSCWCGRIQRSLRGLSRNAGPAPHGVCRDNVSEADSTVSGARCDR